MSIYDNGNNEYIGRGSPLSLENRNWIPNWEGARYWDVDEAVSWVLLNGEWQHD